MSAYYNEYDRHKAAWLRELIADGLIAPGDVDERSIADVQPADLVGYTQCHFFAGIGVWSYALRRAGWPDERPVWTGSCPCQPFSAAGKGDGGADPRHLWPEWFRLIQECGPVVVVGEQVAAALRHGWFDLVSTDVESCGYAVGALSLNAACVGAPHIRQRLYFVAESERGATERCGLAVGSETGRVLGETEERQRVRADVGDGIAAGELGHAERSRCEELRRDGIEQPQDATWGCADRWTPCDWIPCRDGKWRAVEPGVAPLVDGPARGVVPGGDTSLPDPNNTTEARAMRLRGYGDAIVAPLAEAFIRCYMELRDVDGTCYNGGSRTVLATPAGCLSTEAERGRDHA